MIKVFLRSLLIVCVLTSIVGIIQFFIDPYFLRIGTAFIAFGDQLRANGIYRIEFLQGSFLLAGVIVTLVIVRSNIFKFSMILLFLVGIVLTFHRVTWIITLIVFLLYFIKLKKLKVWQIITLLVFMGTIVYTYLQISPDLIDGFTDNPFVADRLTADSWTDRFGLYNMALKKIPQYFLFGVGSPRSEEYFHGVLSAGGSYEVALGKVGGIHNLYLLIAFFHGVPTAIFFTIFCITCFIFLWRKISITGKYFFMPAMVVLMYILQNLLNMFYLYNDLGLLLAMFLGMAVAVYKSNNISSNIILNNSSTNK